MYNIHTDGYVPTIFTNVCAYYTAVRSCTVDTFSAMTQVELNIGTQVDHTSWKGQIQWMTMTGRIFLMPAVHVENELVPEIIFSIYHIL